MAFSINTLPTELASGVWTGAAQKSAVLAVTNTTPQRFGNVSYMTLATPTAAEFVGAGAAKSSAGAAGQKVAQVLKTQATIRVDQEVQWADEDRQLGALNDLATALQGALAEAVDYGVIHGVSPLQGTRYTPITEFLSQTTNSAELDGAKVDAAMDAAGALVVADGFDVTGAVIDAGSRYTLATARDTTGRLLNPDVSLVGTDSSYRGLPVGASTAVSGARRITGGTPVRAIIGDFDNALRIGVIKEIPVVLIPYGDPDGNGDLMRQNQIALRAEFLWSFAIFDLNAFGKVVDAVA